MSQNLWMTLANNSAMLLALFVIYEFSYFISAKNKTIRQIINGILISCICIAVMSMPFELFPGIIFDTRTILISVTAMVFGLIPTAITVTVAVIFRIIGGGAGVYTGVATILSSALIGLAWRRWIYPKRNNWRLLNIYTMSFAVHAAMLVCMFLLPYPQSINVISHIALPIMLIYPITSVLLSVLLMHQQERKLYQKKLSLSEEKYRNITENISDVVWTIGLNLKTTYVSPSVQKLFGETPQEYIDRKVEDKFTPESLRTIRKLLVEELAVMNDPEIDKYRTREVQLEHYKTDGTTIWLSMNISVVRDTNGKGIGFQGVSRDITKRKIAEEALKASEDKYYNYIENAPDGILVTDNSGNFLETNKAASLNSGYSKSELLKISITDLLFNTSDRKVKEYFKELNEEGYSHVEVQYKCKDGAIKWASIETVRIDSSGYLNFVNDVSIRKKAELEVKQERDKAQMYLEVAKVIFVAFDKNINVTLINKEGCKILGLDKSSIIGTNWIDNYIPKRLRTKLKHLSSKIIEGDEEDHRLHENPIIGKNGEERTISWRNVILRDESGEISGILSSGIDITEQKATLKALLESERSKSVFISHIPGIAYRCAYDRDWTMEFISDGCYKLTGYKPEDLINNKKLSYNNLISENYRQKIWEDWKKVTEKNLQYRGEYEIKTASGAVKWVLEMGQAIYDAKGNVEALEGIIIDIDESHKRYEQIQYMNDHDFLTGLYNRRYFEEKKLQVDIEENLPLSIVIADINGVRLINDAFGHLAGDRLIKRTGEIIKECCPENAILARTGGDEFCILLPNTGQIEASELIGCVKQTCTEFSLRNSEESEMINISLGFGAKETKEKNLDEIEKEAEDYMYRRKLLDRESHHNAIIASVMATMYERSQETEEHAERLAQLSVMIGSAMSLPQKDLDDLRLLSMLHDIGKIGIDDRILNKRGSLTTGEWKEMKKHPEIGFRIAMSSSELEPVAHHILHHHERWDGTGYPAGLAGKDIPLLSRILSVADAYDAMTNDRIYRKAMEKSEAIKEIKNKSGTQFDSSISDLFLELIGG